MKKKESSSGISESKIDNKILFRGSGVNLFGKIFGRAFHVLSQVILARILGPASFGLYAIGWTVLNLAGVLATLGLNQGVLKFISNKDLKTNKAKQTIYQALVMGAGVGLFFFLSLFFLSDWLANSVFEMPELSIVLKIFAPAFVLIVIMKITSAATQIKFKMIYSIIIEDFGQTISNLLLIIILCYYLGLGLLGGVVSSTISIGVACFLGLYFTKQIVENNSGALELSDPVNFDLLKFSIPTSLASIFTLFSSRIDRLLIGFYMEESSAGLYQAASQASVLFLLFMGAFAKILIPMIPKLYKSGRIDRLDKLYKVSTKWTLYLCMPILIILLLIPKEFLTIFFGYAYRDAATVLQLLSLAFLLNAATGAVGPILVMTGNQKQWFKISGIMLLGNFFLNTLLIPKYGMIGAAITSNFTMVSLFGVGLIFVKKKVGIWPYDFKLLKVISAFIITFFIMLLFVIPYKTDSLGFLISFSACTVIVYYIIVLLLGIDEEELQIINMFK